MLSTCDTGASVSPGFLKKTKYFHRPSSSFDRCAGEMGSSSSSSCQAVKVRTTKQLQSVFARMCTWKTKRNKKKQNSYITVAQSVDEHIYSDIEPRPLTPRSMDISPADVSLTGINTHAVSEIHTSEAPESAHLIEEALKIIKESHDILSIEVAASLLKSENYNIQSIDSVIIQEGTKIFNQQWYAVNKQTGIIEANGSCIPVRIEKLNKLPNEKENEEDPEYIIMDRGNKTKEKFKNKYGEQEETVRKKTNKKLEKKSNLFVIVNIKKGTKKKKLRQQNSSSGSTF
ncbi:uncharacterized protein [Venturia canescens]|uniref:uncharacterized protein n=1 Tax=Venturia canescens TaxID=32260 RepID=UPI001C9C3380|nr:uncharacterized protein LOC122414497 [Venturia canescens]